LLERVECIAIGWNFIIAVENSNAFFVHGGHETFSVLGEYVGVYQF
jgi:hypothetical protein